MNEENVRAGHEEDERACTCGNHIRREGVHLPGCPLHPANQNGLSELKEELVEEMSQAGQAAQAAGATQDDAVAAAFHEKETLEELCKAAVAGAIKPNVQLLEKAIGTPWELDILPDGTVQWKNKPEILPTVGSENFKEDCFALRAQIEETKIQTMLVIREHPEFNSTEVWAEQFAEMKANLMLAFRHLEDARMRLGKAVQAFDGGKSIYPR